MDAQAKYVKCPKCGQYTRLTSSVRGEFKMYIHKTEKHDEPYPHLAIIEACQVNLRKS